MKRLISLALVPLLAAALSACGSRSDDELMRRVAQAEEAANKAEASAKRAEAAASRLGAGSPAVEAEAAPPPPEPVVEDKPDVDADYGKGTDPVPEDG